LMLLLLKHHQTAVPRGPGARFNSQIALTAGRTGVISRDGSPDRGLDRVLLEWLGFSIGTLLHD